VANINMSQNTQSLVGTAEWCALIAAMIGAQQKKR